MQWMSPVQRAAALKKQQQYMREMEEANRPEWERKKVVMSLGIRGGRVVRTFERSSGTSGGKSTVGGAAADDMDGDDDGEDGGVGIGGGDGGDGQTHSTTRAKLSENPLLRDGKLVRPVWKATPTNDDAGDSEFKDKGILKGATGVTKGNQAQAASERKAMWRRVQDDDEGDNERWILDGGMLGFGDGDGRAEDDGGR